eukprot:GFUD01069845.1.p1 GENE.GFUD01069845.1~~GFUD01069845.1.p1  ORF type:complete len:111 (+),score=23.82 GFUD01069845.1:3-335(+)
MFSSAVASNPTTAIAATASATEHDNVEENYPALVKSLVQLEEAGLRDTATANDIKKADQAAGLLAPIYNLEFVFLLCAICDLHTHCGKSVNVLQIVNILPHEKYDMFEES